MLTAKLGVYSKEETESLRDAIIDAQIMLRDVHCPVCNMFCEECPVRHACRDLDALGDYLNRAVKSKDKKKKGK